MPIQPAQQPNSSSLGKIKIKSTKTGKFQAPKTPTGGGNLGGLGGWLDLSSESKSDLSKPQGQGSKESDYMILDGKMPNLVEAFGGDDSVIMKGGGKSTVRMGQGDDVARFGNGQDPKLKHDSKLNGGLGHDSLFVGQELAKEENFHVTDSKGLTVASTGSDGHRIQIQDVEEVFASKAQQGTEQNDNISSDFKAQETGVNLRESHTIFPSEGDDNIQVATGNKGQSEVSLQPGPGKNRVRFEGGSANDLVNYVSHRSEDASRPGEDTLALRGGSGEDRLNILSQNYSLHDQEGNVLSKLGKGSDKISAHGFEHININGDPLER